MLLAKTEIVRLLFITFSNHLNKSSHWRCSAKMMFLKISQNSQENICATLSFLIKLQVLKSLINKIEAFRPETLFKRDFKACNFNKKETMAQVKHLWFLLNFEEQFFTEHLRTATSVHDNTVAYKRLILRLYYTLHKRWSFPLRISSANVTNLDLNCGFGHIYWRNL